MLVSSMSLTPHDELHLTRALQLAQDATAFASPNPTVGCVLTRGDETLGEGAHLYDHRDHAEIAALKQAASLGHSTQGSTAYVTLEPCAHHGRTGPCSDALIAAGIARCIVATVDPNPLVSGAGLAKLRAAGVKVLLLDPSEPLGQQARRLNDAFAHFIHHGRPFIPLKAALSVDGKLAPPPSTRTSTAPHWITGAAARADAQHLRHTNDAILTGIGTVLADNPSLTDRTGLPRRRPLLRVALDSELRTPLDSELVATAANDLLLVCSNGAPAANEHELLAAGAQVHRVPASHGRINLDNILTALVERHITSVLVEAGAAINGSFLRANLVDKLVLYYAETELGLDAIPFAANYDSPYALQQHLTHITRGTFPSDITPNVEDIRITGYLHDPWSTL
jgi:diaminohydroxyphosphoribosylaminopyrimidine deaminase/5-amino-6-(5-phosphoribosylamino)uracil reductase